MKLLEGKKIADEILGRVQESVSDLLRPPGLAAVLVGDDTASAMYVGLKKKAAHKCGILFCDYILPKGSSQEQIVEVIEHLNNDNDIHGILVQLPLPEHIDRSCIVNAIDSKKDVDGLTDANQACIREEDRCFVCPFPKAILYLLRSAMERGMQNKQAVIIGNSKEFCETMKYMLQTEKIEAQYIFADAVQKNTEMLRRADIIVTAVGQSNLITEDLVKDECIVIDGGIEKVGDSVRGDVASDEFKSRDVTLTPVPGGVGPVTIACLLENTVQAVNRKREKKEETAS